jgi:hypothetical protein
LLLTINGVWKFIIYFFAYCIICCSTIFLLPRDIFTKEPLVLKSFTSLTRKLPNDNSCSSSYYFNTRSHVFSYRSQFYALNTITSKYYFISFIHFYITEKFTFLMDAHVIIIISKLFNIVCILYYIFLLYAFSLVNFAHFMFFLRKKMHFTFKSVTFVEL